jgi:D-alanyl-D-alanine endopeptidase (penicillin-binding protein 7)
MLSTPRKTVVMTIPPALRSILRFSADSLPKLPGRLSTLRVLLGILILGTASCVAHHENRSDDLSDDRVQLGPMPVTKGQDSSWTTAGTALDEWIAANLRTKANRWPRLDPSLLNLHATSALIVDESGNRLYSKNAGQVKPIASITKLMTAMVVLDARVSMKTPIKIIEDDRDRLRNSRSRLRINEATLSRGDMIAVSVMSSDNRAAHALARTTFRGGTPAFIAAMNRKAKSLGMSNTYFADSSGLNGNNRSSAEDLVKLVKAADSYPFIREITAKGEMTVRPFADGSTLQYRNSNSLVKDPDWHIDVSKTGFIRESGYCLAMQTRIDNRRVTMIFLDAPVRWAMVSDSQQVRDWLMSSR